MYFRKFAESLIDKSSILNVMWTIAGIVLMTYELFYEVDMGAGANCTF